MLVTDRRPKPQEPTCLVRRDKLRLRGCTLILRKLSLNQS